MPNKALSTSAAAEINVFSLTKLEKGMTQAQVLKIMRHPYDDTIFVMDGDTYDVWFYVTEPTMLGQSRMMPMNLTPLTFKNGILIGWGHLYYNYLKKRKLEADNAKLAPAPVQDNLEDKKLEKILQDVVPGRQVTPSQPATSPSSPPVSLPQPSAPKPSAPKGGREPPRKEPGQKKPTKSSAPPSQTAPDWSPLEPQSEQPVPQKTNPSQVSMSSSKPAQKQDQPPPPLDEEDERMLQEEREQDFDQT